MRTKYKHKFDQHLRMGSTPKWKRVGYALGLTIWVILLVFVIQAVLGWLMFWLLGSRLADPVWTAVYSAGCYVLAFLAIYYGTPRLIAWGRRIKLSRRIKARNFFRKTELEGESRASRRELGLIGWPTWTDIGLALVGLIVSLILAKVLTDIFSVFPWFDSTEQQDLAFSFLLTGGERVIAFLILVVVAPIIEELIFRGWLYGNLRETFEGVFKCKGGQWWGVAWSILLVSLAFAILHGQWSVGVTVFAMSVVMCGLREITGTIYAGILLHMLKNGIAFFLLYMM